MMGGRGGVEARLPRHGMVILAQGDGRCDVPHYSLAFPALRRAAFLAFSALRRFSSYRPNS